MSEELDVMGTSLFNNQVPALWAAKCYPSLMPLASWVNDFIRRLDFIQRWVDNGAPPNFWISGFFFPQALVTGVKQNYARKNGFSVDTVSFDFKVLGDKDPEELVTA